jgi:predicted dehydrogenase
MAFLQHIPGTNPVVKPPRHPRAMGVGVIGLHEGRTLLFALETRCAAAFAVAGCDVSDEKIAASRAELPHLFYTTDYGAMLRHPGVDIVAIYTPDSMHAEHIVRAFDAGKDVICTKPLVNSIDGARQVLEVARRTRRTLLVGQSTRFFEPFLRQRRDHEKGAFGTLELVDAHYIHRMDWFYEKSKWAATDTDWVYLGMSHPLDLLRWYLGPIRSVHAIGRTSELGAKHGLKSHDIYTVNVIAMDGRLGRAMGHYGVHELPRARNCIELMLYGSRGSSLAQYHDMRYVHAAADNTEVVEDHLYAGRHYYFNSEVHGMHYGEFANYADHFAGALIDGMPHSPNLDEGIETFCLMEAVKHSASTGEVVALAPILREVGL